MHWKPNILEQAQSLIILSEDPLYSQQDSSDSSPKVTELLQELIRKVLRTPRNSKEF